MTARQQVRTGSAAKAPETWSIETQRAPQVGEILQTARERKGIDLVRAERETKIRARHLVALESGDLDDLPATVYAKGFLRNYSLYLGLDPDEMLSRWRREADRPRTAETVKVAPPPQPITAPRQGFKLTSGLVVAVVLSLIVAGFVGYVALQLVRFSQNPEIAVSGPSVRRLNSGATTMNLDGTSAPNARVTATGAGEVIRTTTADPAGEWSMELPVAKGRNDFVITSLDVETGRESVGLELIANVPVGTVQDPDAPDAPVLPDGASTPTLAGTPSAEVVIGQPKDKSDVRNGVVKLRGTSDSQTVLVSFQWLGAEDRESTPPDPVELEVVDGSFKGSFTLPRGRWQVAAAGSNDGGPADIATSRVKVVYDQLIATVRAVEGQTRIQITADGELVTEPGKRLREGQEATFRATDELIVQVGNAKAAHVVVDGIDHGAMGRVAGSKTWRFEPGQDPQPVP
jgi:cytoskeletal protein RodZ